MAMIGGFNLPDYRAQSSSPPPPAAMGSAAAAAASGGSAMAPTPYLAPVASYVADQAGRVGAGITALTAPARDRFAAAGQYAQQGDYGRALGAGLAGGVDSVGATLGTATGAAALPFYQAGKLGYSVLSGAFGNPSATATAPAGSAAAATMPAPTTPHVAGVPITPAQTLKGNTDAAAAVALSQAGQQQQGQVAGSTGTGTNPQSATHSLFGSLPAFMVPQMVDALTKSKAAGASPIGQEIGVQNAIYAGNMADLDAKRQQGGTAAQLTALEAYRQKQTDEYIKNLKSLQLATKIPVAAPE